MWSLILLRIRRGIGIGFGRIMMDWVEVGSDPDSASAVLQRYNQELWSKELSNGEKMELTLGENVGLSWNGFRFGSDSIITSFRYKRQRALLERVAESMDDYRGFVEDFFIKLIRLAGRLSSRSMQEV